MLFRSMAEPRPIEAAEWAGADWVVTGGVKPGDRVIVDGLMRLGPGAPVRIAEKKGEDKQSPKPAAKKA